MEKSVVWLIDHKAKLGKWSPLNLDGSDWILGICVLSAGNQQSAEAEFQKYLHENKLELMELYEFTPYKGDQYRDDSDRTRQVNYAVGRVRDEGATCYVYARTSETMRSYEDDAGE